MDDDFPGEWGRTSIGSIARDQEGAWVFPNGRYADWREIVYPSEPDGTYHHGTGGAIAPDTVAIAYGEEIVALADTGHLVLSNIYALDNEYYQFLRLREVLAPQRWSALPWAEFGPGRLLHAWDKFHDMAYFRISGLPPVATDYDDPGSPGEPAVMTYGGDWYDLAVQVEHEYPTGRRSEPVTASEACLLRAISADNLAVVKEQLAAGANPDAGDAPGGAWISSFSDPRDESALSLSILHGSPEMTEALLSAGADVHRLRWRSESPLQFTIDRRSAEHIPVLLRHGADPLRVYRGKTALEWAWEWDRRVWHQLLMAVAKARRKERGWRERLRDLFPSWF